MKRMNGRKMVSGGERVCLQVCRKMISEDERSCLPRLRGRLAGLTGNCLLAGLKIACLHY